jgi:hypothetical protein
LSDDSNLEQVRVGEIPPELMEDPPMYSVTLVGIRQEIECVHCGSGTFVKTGDRHFILTANHCAKPLFELERFGLPIRLGDKPLMIEKIPLFMLEPGNQTLGGRLSQGFWHFIPTSSEVGH